MNVINLLKNVLLKSQFYVSFCATSLGIYVLKEQESLQLPLVAILFLTFWNGYFFTVFHKYKDAIFVNLVGFALISFLIFYFLTFDFYVKWLTVLLLGMFYNADYFKINLREFSVVKTFYVGFVWAMSLVWLPFEKLNWVWFLIIFLFTSAITFPFEIRDIERDNFMTLPKKIGFQNTKYLSYVFLFLCTVLGTYFLKIDFAIALYSTIFISYLLIYFADKNKSNTYYSFYMESLSALPLVFLLLMKTLK